MSATTASRPAAACSIEPGSFRDRTARVFYADGAVCRGLTASAWDEWQHVSSTPFFARAMAAGKLVATEPVAASSLGHVVLPAEWKGVLRHETIPFVSYPYEWCFGMLRDAALLQLELLAEGIEQHVTLKDATPFNVQWIGARPVFIDVGSFVRWRSGDPWAGYRQFCRMFLYPLLMQAYKGVPFQPRLRGRLDGIDAEECRCVMSWRDVIRPGVFKHVVVQGRLERKYGSSTRDIRRELRQAGFNEHVIAAGVAGLQRLVGGLTWSPGASTWSEYAGHNSYGPEASLAKERFVDAALRAKPRRLVWDLGCNTGRFSKLAASHAEYVLAVDADHASIERLYADVKRERLPNVLPFVADVTDPSPALGWRGRERRAMLERGRPDLVLCLALVHHLAIAANIPVADLLAWFAELGADLVIEFPTPDDPMVKRLLLNKDQAYDDYRVESFEGSLARWFEVRDRLTLAPDTRILYYATPRG